MLLQSDFGMSFMSQATPTYSRRVISIEPIQMRCVSTGTDGHSIRNSLKVWWVCLVCNSGWQVFWDFQCTTSTKNLKRYATLLILHGCNRSLNIGLLCSVCNHAEAMLLQRQAAGRVLLLAAELDSLSGHQPSAAIVWQRGRESCPPGGWRARVVLAQAARRHGSARQSAEEARF